MKLHESALRGPHPVGNRSFEMSNPERAATRMSVDVWYPGQLPTTGTRDLARASHPLGMRHEAHPDLAAAAGPFPAVLFSHGNSGYRQQSTFLTAHLASWGFVVVAPDHPGNTFSEMQAHADEEARRAAHLLARAHRPGDLCAVLDALIAQPEGLPKVDADRIGALGHSFGGWTSIKMARRDPRVRAICGLAPASEPFVGRKAFEPDELPFSRALPLLMIAGLDDVLVDFASSVRPLADRMARPHALLGVEGFDHFHFCDGIPLLHGVHEGNHRPQQLRMPRPYAELLQEARSHRILQGLVTAFFCSSLIEGQSDPFAQLDATSLTRFDSNLRDMD